jgi:hypothetical protein
VLGMSLKMEDGPDAACRMKAGLSKERTTLPPILLRERRAGMMEEYARAIKLVRPELPVQRTPTNRLPYGFTHKV